MLLRRQRTCAPHAHAGCGAQVLSAAIATGALVWALKVTLSYMDPYREQRREVRHAQQQGLACARM